jgi:predicted HAD superfamily phosphohydrolase YqeG
MLRDKNHALYQNIASSGTPLNLTISEYRKLRKEVQSTYADQIKLINATNSKDVGSLATRLKVEFMAAGMSAEEATKKIYAMIAASNKQSQSALATVGNKSFTDIASGKDVGVAAVQNFDTASTLGTTQDQIAALNTALQGIDQAIQSTVEEARKAAIATGKSFNEEAATAKATADEIAKIGNKHQKVSIDLIDSLLVLKIQFLIYGRR